MIVQSKKIFFFLFIFLCSIQISTCNVCKKSFIFQRWVPQPYVRTVRETYRGNCFFRCTKTRINKYYEEKIVLKTFVGSKDVCCSGYIEDDLGTPREGELHCKPVCSSICHNGYCAEPEKCLCNPGYELHPKFKNKCVPVCTNGCEHGSCIGPDTCECNFGYHLKDNTCQPICNEPCVNATCIAPDKCECFLGYRETENNVCQPYCSKGCLNGICTSPENCTCNDGWYKEEEKCKPYCEFDCGGGTCVAPNSCVCNPNYIKAENLTCVPHCSQGCANGICVSPENCVCNKGWAKSNDLNVCLPHCEFECGGGICASPNVCECYAGYIMSANGTCIPHCPQGCPHGQCVQPGNCSCENGWYKNETHDECRPICDNNCINSVCVAPNTCECLSNYTKAENDSCVPYCSSGCPNGTCVNPEECECNDGWQNNENGICEPKCNSPCGNGKCIEPDVCECFPGYKFNIDNDVKYSNGLCIPECTGCNGTCIAPNNCVCDSPLQAVNVTEDGQKCDCIDFCFEGQNICRGTACVLNDTFVSTSDGLYDTTESTIISTITDEVRSDGMTTDNILEETSSSSFDSDTLRGSQGIYQIPYWAYFAIPSITIVLIVSSILICTRRAISQYCKGSSYVVEDDEILHGSVSFNNVRSNPLKPEPELISGDI